MLYNRELLEKLDKFTAAPWQGAVYRFTLGEYPPDRENTRGARWNPVDVATIYTSLSRDVVLAEGERLIAVQGIPPTAKRNVYTIEVKLYSVMNLADKQDLTVLGLTDADVAGDDHFRCQLVGGAVEWLGHDGLLVPSARTTGTNLVIFPSKRKPDHKFEIIDREIS